MHAFAAAGAGVIPIAAAAGGGMVDDIGHRAEIFRHPHEVDSQPGRGNLSGGDERVQGAGELHHGARAGGIVIGAPLGVVKVGGDEYLAVRILSAADISMHQREFAGAKGGIDLAAHAHWALLHERAEHLVLVAGDLEAATGLFQFVGAGPSAVVAHHVGVVRTVGSGRIDDHTEGAALDDSFAHDVGGVSVGESHFAADVLAGVIGVAGAFAQINQLA